MNRIFYSFVILLNLNLSTAYTQDSSGMNLLFILADDLGWSDTSVNNPDTFYETPNIERLAKMGMTFNRAYANSAICSPTRASILTGQTPARHGITAPRTHHKRVVLKPTADAKDKPGIKATRVRTVTRLNNTIPTLGKLLKQAGYATGHFGKWHVGNAPYTPLEHGFDLDLPHWQGPGPAGSFVAPWKYPNFKHNFPKEHIEDRMAQEAVSWMASLPKQKPFFLNYWQFSVHSPFDAKAALIDYYRSKLDPDHPQNCPTYAAMIHSMDDAVGALLDALEAKGILEKTVIIFTSDNGGNMYDKVDGTTPTNNHPLRGGKCTVFDGGLRVPLIVAWPGITTPGMRSDEIVQTSDFYPTIINRLGIDSDPNHAVDGIDITPALKGEPLEREAIFTYFPYTVPKPDWLPASAAVHSGDWKLIRLFYEGKNGQHAYHLYNLKDDVGETVNLAEHYPEKVKHLDNLLEQHLKETKAVTPRKNPAFDPAHYRPEYVGLTPEEQNALN